MKAADDPLVAALRDSGAGVVTLVAKSHDRHVELALRTTLEENLAMIRDTVTHLREEGQPVFLDAEHFFDGYRANRDYALEVLRTAYDAGAEVVALCDTNGGMLPGWVADVVHDVVETHRGAGRHPLPQRHRLRGRQHPRRRRRRRHATCRARSTGTASAPATPTWSPSSPTSSSSWTGRCCRRACSREATRIAHAVAEVTNFPPASRQPYVGTLGVHAQGRPARQRDQGRPEPLPAHGPGRRRQRHAAAGLRHGRPGVDRAQGPRARLRPVRATDRSWSPGSPTGSRRWRTRGYTFEAADASFELLLIEEVEGARPSYFDVESWRVITETQPAAGDEAVSEATVKLRADGVRFVVTGEGNGPVNALDHALREAIGQAYPEVAKFELIDYKVRILDQGHGTDAITRVLIETSDGESSWVTVGVGANVIEASWGALVDGSPSGCAGTRAARRPEPAQDPLGRPGRDPAGEVDPAVEDPVDREPLDGDLLVEDRRLERGEQRDREERQVAGDAELGEQVAHVHRGEGVRRERAGAGAARRRGSARRAAAWSRGGSGRRPAAGPTARRPGRAAAARTSPRPATRSRSG